MKKLIYLLLLVVFSSCRTYYYYPTFQNIPTNSKSNEIQGTYFIDVLNKGFSLSYSFRQNFGAFTTINTFSGYDFKNGAYLSDFGLFYFKNINFSDNDDVKMTMALSSAYGYGENRYRHEFYDMSINRVFLQPSFSFTSRFFDCGISYRFSYVNYSFEINNNAIPEYDNNNLLEAQKNPFYFGEPHIFCGVGYKWIKLNYHYVSALKFSNPEIPYVHNANYISLSIKYDLDKLFKK